MSATERRLRLTLSLLAEPGSLALADLLAAHPVEAVVEACRGAGEVEVPDGWRERAVGVDDLVTEVIAGARVSGQRWVCPGHPDWPEHLSDLDEAEPASGAGGAPLGLWVRGEGSLAKLCDRAVAIVGARSCTTYGAEVASDIAADVADRGWGVVSGAAFGVDASAHRGALAIHGTTVAVLACGADVEYPRSNAALLTRILESSGLIVSEYPPGETAQRHRFLSRNRVIAALGRGTVVVEAAQRSGSLNTLHWADRLGRVSMVVPGPVTSQQSSGTHAAVRDGKAVLVTSGTDVIEELDAVGWGSAEASEADPVDLLPEVARRALDGFDADGSRTLAEVAAHVRLGRAEVRRAAELLQRRGLIARRGEGWVLRR